MAIVPENKGKVRQVKDDYRELNNFVDAYTANTNVGMAIAREQRCHP